MTSSITFELLHRKGFQTDLIKVADRLSLDFVVDGQSLYTLLMEVADLGDRMSAFVSDRPRENLSARAVLLLRRRDPDLKTRAMLYVCPECGDIQCGAMTVEITKTGNTYTWQNFAYEGYPGDDLVEHLTFPEIGPFTFHAEDYEPLIERAPAMVEFRGLVH